MSPVRTFAVTVVVAVLAAPLGSVAASAGEPAASCAAPASVTERRIAEEAANGLPSLIRFVNRTQAIYQLRLVDAVAWLDAERARRTACTTASAQSVTD